MVKILKINLQTQSQSQGLQDRKILKTLNKKEMMIVKERWVDLMTLLKKIVMKIPKTLLPFLVKTKWRRISSRPSKKSLTSKRCSVGRMRSCKRASLPLSLTTTPKTSRQMAQWTSTNIWTHLLTSIRCVSISRKHRIDTIKWPLNCRQSWMKSKPNVPKLKLNSKSWREVWLPMQYSQGQVRRSPRRRLKSGKRVKHWRIRRCISTDSRTLPWGTV